MYLSIGNDMAVRDRAVIGIFDLDNTSTSKRTREFLDRAEKEGQVVPCDDLPKSFVLTSEYGFSREKRGNDVYSHPQFMPTSFSRCMHGAAAQASRTAGISL